MNKFRFKFLYLFIILFSSIFINLIGYTSTKQQNFSNQNLISTKDTKILVKEMSTALASKGLSIIYGPFMRSGKLVSKRDIEFHYSLINTDPDLGYKNDVDMMNLFSDEGLLHLSTEIMPANNLAFILQKS